MTNAVRGVYNILTTPFLEDGSLDEDSLRGLTEATITAGVDGITVLGVAGEAHKLLEDERRRVVELVMQVNAGRVPIVVGASRDATDTTIAACREAEANGAAAVMVAPPTFAQPGAGLVRHFQAVGAAIGIPIVLQDYPPINGVTLSPGAMAELANATPAITSIKLEDPPTPQRIAQTRALLENSEVTIIGGFGGSYLLDELRRGGDGTMTGFAYPEVLIDIWRAWNAGDRRRAAEIYYRFLPLIVFEGQPKLGLAIRKETLRRRGLISSNHVRQPGPALDPGTAADLTETLEFLGLGARYELLV